MKKRTTALFTLAVGLLVGASVAAPVSISIARANEGNAPVAVAKYDISVKSIEGIAVEVAQSAEVGSLVEAIVRASSDDIESIDGLLVDGFPANKVEEGVFKFIMPNHAVELLPQYTKLEPVAKYAIRHSNENGVKVEVQERANKGDNIAFAITFDAFSGYSWNGFIDVFTINNAGEKVEEVEYVSLGDVLFTFEMPASDVFIEVGMEKRTFSLTKFLVDDNERVLDAYGNMYLIEGETRTVIAEQSDVFARAQVGSLIRVELHDTEYYKVAGLFIPETGEELPLDEKGYVEFTLPARNISLVVNYETRYYEVDVTNSDHITLEVYHKVEDELGEETLVLDENEKPLVQYKETVYIKAVSSDLNYGVKSIHYKAMEGEMVVYDHDLDLDHNGYYVFTSNGVMTSQTLVVTEVVALVNDAITVTNSDHVSGTVKVQDGDELVGFDEEHRVYPNNKIYFDFVSDDPLFGLKEAKIQYQVEGDETLLNLETSMDNVFGLPYAVVPANAVKISVILTDQPYFDSYGFTGSYVGKTLNTTLNTISSNAYLNTITDWGVGLINDSDGFGVRTVTPDVNEPNSGSFVYHKASGVATLKDGQYLPPANQDAFTNEDEYIASYSSKFVVFSDKSDAAVTPSSSNIQVAVKRNELLAVEPNIRFDTVEDELGDRWYIVTSAYEGEIDGVLAINLTQGIVYNNTVDVIFSFGENIDDSDAFYELVYGAETLLQLGKDEGETVILDGYQGYYTVGEDKLLVLDGIENVTYGDVQAKYTIDEASENPTIHFTDSRIVEDTYVTTDYTAVLNLADATAVVQEAVDVKQSAQPTITYSEQYPFVYNELKGTYTSGNKGKSGTSSMFIDCEKDGLLMFDYEVGGEGSYDYATIKKNDEVLTTFKGYEIEPYHLKGHMEIEVAAGDKITISFRKDGGGNKDIDSIIVSNLHYFVNEGGNE